MGLIEVKVALFQNLFVVVFTRAIIPYGLYRKAVRVSNQELVIMVCMCIR